mmetsp:Transcript_12529/g.39785  ORF Transcript_12529/g.39785 Transcript_12529/m.39785 type:complete len:152 (-) Transcript_12529:319-774(-)|eukprot:CAMPEP_0197400526 /NCGR_PEP_ID=MMETSP1165-20131217/17047_1 /TAXON_ID=284809 /ORGANISM="Chrysocystis fragilis, Strain CCMP3189" /LENGTH=151 /DNA_ID=CAMNT_0042926597 /DNA_START=63 /DNA_END=518 /DNA_ORIENTATION=+
MLSMTAARGVMQRAGRSALARGAGATRALSHSDFETKRHPVPGDSEGVQKMIEEQVKENKVMLYMKGTPAMPQCGFSQQVVRILHATGVEFSSVNVLEDMSIREGIKQYSEWPTIPQLYVDGEFVGGCDIVTQSFQSGELEETLKSAGALK